MAATASAAAGLVLVLLSVWLFWPARRQLEPSYSTIAPRRVDALSTLSPGVPAEGATDKGAALPAEPEISAPEHRYTPIAQVACKSSILQTLQARSRNSKCGVSPASLDSEIEQAIESHAKMGITIDRELCISHDSAGEVTDLESVWADVAEISKAFVRSGFEPLADARTRNRYYRVMSVGLCSVKKSADYWADHLEEIPQVPDDLVASIYFDPTTGRPEKSARLAAFIELLRIGIEEVAARSPNR